MEKVKVPKVEYAKGKEKLTPETEAALMQTGRRVPTPEERDKVRAVCRFYGLPVNGVTLLGGRLYVNVTGLDDRVNRLWLDKGWVKAESSKVLQRPSRENKNVAGYEVQIDMFNERAFTEGMLNLAKVAQNGLASDTIETLKKVYTVSFKAEGWASPESCEAIAYSYKGPTGSKVKDKLLIENVMMMAERKASNRAKRAATSCGLTSTEEVGSEEGQVIDIEPEEEIERKPKVKKKREEKSAEKKAEEKAPKEERPVQEPDERGNYDPNGPPSKAQWRLLEEIKKKAEDKWREEILDPMGIVLESELTLDQADRIIRNTSTAKKEKDELPLED